VLTEKKNFILEEAKLAMYRPHRVTIAEAVGISCKRKHS
jgi:hypothetical protein